MKTTFIATLCAALLFLSPSVHSQSSVEILSQIVQTPEITSFFEGTFNSLGIRVKESDERITLHHRGDRIEVQPGLDESAVDFILDLDLRGIDNVVAYTDDGKIDDDEATKIARVFFTPFTKVTMQNPVLAENRKRKAAGIEDLIHVYLQFQDGSTAAAHTLVYVSDQWLVIDGIYGEAKRTFHLTHQPALDYQRKVFSAIQTDTKKGWIEFLKWYKEWRPKYSTTNS